MGRLREVRGPVRCARPRHQGTLASMGINSRILDGLVGMLDNQADLNAVRVFAAVADAGSFHGAAVRLALPRSTVSHRVAQLEARLGVRLLARTTRRVALTEAGRAYLEQVRVALQLLDEADHRMAGLTDVPRGTVRVSLAYGVATQWLGPVANAFLSRYPEASLVVDLSDRYVDLVGEGYDVALRAGELADSGLTSRLLGTMTTRCFVSPAWLAQHGPIDHPRDLAHHDVILFHPERVATWVFEGPERVSVEVRGRYAVRHHPLNLEAAEQGHGVARLPPVTVEASVAAGRLVPILPEWSSPPMRLHLVTAGASLRTAAVAAFVALVVEHVGRGLEGFR